MTRNMKIVISILLVIIGGIGMFKINNMRKSEYGPNNIQSVTTSKTKNIQSVITKNVKRSELENAVVGTALQYLYKHRYSDYEQKQLDAGLIYGLSNGKVTRTANNNKVNKFNYSYSFRTFNTTPEGISRTNQFFIDCSSFSMSVYLNALNFDFSSLLDKQYDKQNISFTANYDNKAKVTINSKEKNCKSKYKTSYTSGNTRVLGTSILNNAVKGVNKSKPIDNTSYSIKNNNKLLDNKYIVYYHELNDNRVIENGKVVSGTTTINYSNEKKIYEEMRALLKPGDLIIRRKGVVDEAGYDESGHVVLFVGNKLGVSVNKNGKWVNETHNYGIIEAKGGDLNREYTFSNNGSTSGRNKDAFSIRYTEDFDYMIFDSKGVKTMKYLILRPINEFCPNNTNKDNDNCTISNSHPYFGDTISAYNKSVARTKLHDVTSEQYIMTSSGRTIGNYNTNRPGNNIRVRFRYTKPNNLGNFGYCTTKVSKSIYNAGTQLDTIDPVDESEETTTADKENDVISDTTVNTSMTKTWVGEKGCVAHDGYAWKRLKSNISRDTTDKVTVTASIPSWGKFEKCSDNCVKTKNSSGKVIKVTWKNLSYKKAKTIEYTLHLQGDKVKRKIPGFVITNGNSSLNLPDIDININNSITSKVNRTEIINSINKLSKWSNQFDAINKVYQNMKFYSNNKPKRISNYSVFDTNDTNTLLNKYFSKINGSEFDYQLNTNSSFVVPGMYGGKLLRGNDARHATSGAQKNVNRIKYMTEADFELGDVLLLFDLNINKSTINTAKFVPKTYIYYGHGKFVRFTDKKYTYYNQELNSNNRLKVTQYKYSSADLSVNQTYKRKTGWNSPDYFVRGIYNSDLFVVIRPITDTRWT